jgi:hypothetical protein
LDGVERHQSTPLASKDAWLVSRHCGLESYLETSTTTIIIIVTESDQCTSHQFPICQFQ